jgi:hypothetical protein
VTIAKVIICLPSFTWSLAAAPGCVRFFVLAKIREPRGELVPAA